MVLIEITVSFNFCIKPSMCIWNPKLFNIYKDIQELSYELLSWGYFRKILSTKKIINQIQSLAKVLKCWLFRWFHILYFILFSNAVHLFTILGVLFKEIITREKSSRKKGREIWTRLRTSPEISLTFVMDFNSASFSSNFNFEWLKGQKIFVIYRDFFLSCSIVQAIIFMKEASNVCLIE